MNSLGFTNPRVQRLRRLLGRRSFRVEEGVIVIEGAKVLEEAMDSRATIEGVYVGPGADSDPIVVRARSQGVPVHALAAGVSERLGETASPQRVFALASVRLGRLDETEADLRAGGFAVVCDRVSDPGNAGTIIRCAEAAGAACVVFSAGSVDATSPKALRSSAGALFHVPVVQSDDSAEGIVVRLAGWGVHCYATSSVIDGGVPYDGVELRGPTAFVLGNEANGISAEVMAACSGLIAIPMVGRTESLNVAAAAAVLVFEAARQRRRR